MDEHVEVQAMILRVFGGAEEGYLRAVPAGYLGYFGGIGRNDHPRDTGRVQCSPDAVRNERMPGQRQNVFVRKPLATAPSRNDGQYLSQWLRYLSLSRCTRSMSRISVGL